MTTDLTALNNRIQTEGFNSKEECETARRGIKDRLESYRETVRPRTTRRDPDYGK